MRIAIGSDHTALDLKAALVDEIAALGHEAVDLGTHTTASTDYPIYGVAVGRAVADGNCHFGVVLCGTGVGISMAANRVPGVRCACVSEPYSAEMTRRHNDANVLAMGARVVGQELARSILRTFLHAKYDGGRHQRRVDQLDRLSLDPHALDSCVPHPAEEAE